MYAIRDFFRRLRLAIRYVRNGHRHLFRDVLSGRRSGSPRRAAPAQARHGRVDYGVRTLRARLQVLELELEPESRPETDLLRTGTG